MQQQNKDEKIPENNKIFDSFGFENKLIEVIEELRLKRKLEVENEKNLKKILQEKYDLETFMEDQQRKFLHEKSDLDQQITHLKRKVEDKFFLADDEKVKLQLITKTFAQEVRALKEESRELHSEKLNLEKKIQELEGKLKLHTNFQETAMRQMNEVRHEAQELSNLCQGLTLAQNTVNDNVAEVKILLEQYELCNRHLSKIIQMNEDRNASLKKEIVTLQTKFTLKMSNSNSPQKNPEKSSTNEKDYQTIEKLENVILQTRNASQKTANSLHESSKLLSQYVEKLEEAKENKNVALKEIESLQSELTLTKGELELNMTKLRQAEENHSLIIKRRQEMISEDTQVDTALMASCDESTQTDKCYVIPAMNTSNEAVKDNHEIIDASSNKSNVVDDDLELEKESNAVKSKSPFPSNLNYASDFSNILVPITSETKANLDVPDMRVNLNSQTMKDLTIKEETLDTTNNVHTKENSSSSVQSPRGPYNDICFDLVLSEEIEDHHTQNQNRCIVEVKTDDDEVMMIDEEN